MIKKRQDNNLFLLIELGLLFFIQDFLLINNQLELYIPLYLTICSNSEMTSAN